ncbi:MAG TPA: ribosome biogenesis GTP-binding protein YihA/YsxC [Candidatus Binatia bacterium]|nr:ribosome biogenesis GTP-binding protein YihA/YsxC [Candidatus Binatia bacterium]
MAHPDMNISARRLHISATRPEDFPRGPRPHIAFMGRSNVGKSSLLNILLGAKGLARTSKDPGRTRALNFFLVNDRIFFVDLPGFGYAKISAKIRQQWKGLVEAYLTPSEGPDLALHLVDSRHEPTDMDDELREWLQVSGIRHQVVLTKIDKLSGRDRASSMKRAARWLGLPEGTSPLAVSSTTGQGIPALWRVIDDVLSKHQTFRPERADGPAAGAATQGGRPTL